MRLICAISAAIVVMVVTVPERGWLVAAFVALVAAAVVYSLLGILSWWFDWSDLAD